MDADDVQRPDVPFFSVVVPFKNAEEHFRHSLPAFTALDFKNVEFILVDNGSSDGSVRLAQEWASTHPERRWTLLSESTPGAAAARNRGAEVAKSDWLVFTDADCLPDRLWLTDLATAAVAAPPEVAALAGCIQPAPLPSLTARFLGLYTLPPILVPQTYRAYTLVSGGFPSANFAVRLNAFRAVNGMDTSYASAGEDHDFCRRLYSAGFTIRTLPNAVVRHRHRDSLWAMLHQTFRFGTAHARLLKTQPSGVFIIQTPGISLIHHSRARIWMDLNQADKKLLGILILAGFWPPGACLIPIYLLFLAAAIFRRAMRRGVPLAWWESGPAALFLVAKAAALTAGRLTGSLRHRVLCV